MIGMVRKSGLCSRRTTVLNIGWQLMITPVCGLRASNSFMRRKGPLLPKVSGKLWKDSDLIDPEVDSDELDIDAGHLERSYGEYVSEVKEDRKKLRRILTMKKMCKRIKEPNMLTFNEREHMKYLHKSDPNEWTVERLSESFPALPHVVRKILKEKWKPNDMEAIKRSDTTVMENWEKLKKNELQASPEVLNHVKKFVNKHDNLKVQLKNSKFFPELDVQNDINWQGDGPLTKSLLKYKEDVENLRSRHFEKIGLIQEGERSLPAVSGTHMNTIEEDVKKKLENTDINDDSIMIGKPRLRDKEVTLDDLKQSVLEKTERGTKLVSKFEEALLNKILHGSRRFQNVAVTETDDDDSKEVIDESERKGKGRGKRSENLIRNVPKEKAFKVPVTRMERPNRTPEFDDENFSEDENLRYDSGTHNLNESEVGLFLSKLRSEKVETETKVEPSVRKQKTPVKYYGTEKDNEMVQRNCDLLSGTAFWGRTKKIETKATSLEALSTVKNPSPHLAPTLSTYYSYDYPDKINIPKNKWVKGMTFRVKDCYYDDDGEFLYRVPGLTQD